jgi:opacity protein-like surface antigen
MRTYVLAVTSALLLSSAVYAQPASPSGTTPAINSPNSPPNPGAPVAGANSFTEGQAKSRIESNGYANVGGLQKDGQGVWRGKAMKDGKSVNVSLDFQGNVTAQ